MAGQNDDNMTIRPNHSKPHGNGVGETNEESMNCERNETGDAIKPKAVKREYAPSRQEMEDHLISHYPFKAWCEHCVRGKAKGKAHNRMSEEDKDKYQIPIISMDYMFMGTKQSKEEERGNPILVMKDKDGRHAGTGMRFAHVLPNKGVDD